MQQHGHKYFACRPLPQTCVGGGLKVKIQFFRTWSIGHDAYQNEGSHKCSYMVAYTLPADPLDPGGGTIR